MDFMLDLPVIAWTIAYTALALLIPVWIVSKLIRVMTNSGKKTYRTIRR